MGYRSIDEVFAANEAALERFVPVVSGLSAAQENFRPAEGRWTIAEITEHVAIVNHGFLRIVSRLMKQAEEEGAGAAGDLDLGPTLPDTSGPRIRVEAPERVHPGGGKPVAESLPRMRETLAGFRAIQRQIEAIDLSGPTLPHPLLGPINAYQWMVLLAEHQDRHLEQIEEVRSRPDYPRA